MLLIRRACTLVPVLLTVVASVSIASTSAGSNHGHRTCDPASAKTYRARADALYNRARYNDAGNAFTVAAQFSRDCATPEASLDTAISVARAGGSFGEAGKVDLGLANLRLAQTMLSSIVVRYPQISQARDYLATVQATIDSIDSQFM